MSETLFDYAAAQRLRDEGLLKASSYPADEWVRLCRDMAVKIAEQNGDVTINCVMKRMQRLGINRPDGVHPNATGAIMRDKRLVLVGFQKSDKVSAHARRVGLYRRAW